MTLPTPEEVVREMTRPIELNGDNFAWQRRAERIIAERDNRVAAEALRDAADRFDAIQADPGNSSAERARRDPALWLVEQAYEINPEESK